MKRKPFEHDCRRSIWLIAGGYWCWCYRCGAIRVNEPGSEITYPTGKGGANPAMTK